MSNSLAQLVLFSWPLVVFLLFRRLPLPNALVWSIVAGYLVLPTQTGFDPPILPTVDKTLIPSLTAAIMCLLVASRLRREAARPVLQSAGGLTRAKPTPKLAEFEPKRGQALFWGLLIFLFTTPILTAMQNGESIVFGTRFLKGMSLYDAVSINSTLLVQIIPFLLARRFLSSEEDQKTVLKILVLACLGYSLLALYEVRMSPMINHRLYGFFPHNWSQHVRGEGYRPIIFLQHGLFVSIFFCAAVIAAFSYWKAARADTAGRHLWLLCGLWLFGVLFLTKSLGAFALAVLFVPVVLFLGRGARLLVAAGFAVLVLLYPLARSVDVVPVGTVVKVAEAIDPSRARSFKFRVYNEDILLAKANQKPLTGWGGWGRSRIYNDSGKDISTTDGYWVIVMGELGKLGYLAQFGLLCLPLVLLSFRQRKIVSSDAAVGMSLALCVGLIDLLPNATISPVLWLVAGAVLGHYQTAAAREETKQSRARPGTQIDPVPQAALPAATIEATAPLHQRRPRQARYE